MRILFSVAALWIAGFSILFDFVRPALQASACELGLCRFDQLFKTIDAQGLSPATLPPLLRQDSSNPLVWCTYAESLVKQERTEEAAMAFDHAISLGPSMPPVLMRAANFAFTNNRTAQSLQLTQRILRQTEAFDGILFSYLTASQLPVTQLENLAIPPQSRPARSWLAWLSTNGSDEDLRDVWAWMRHYGLGNEKSALELAWTLWQRNSFASSQQVWCDWRQGDCDQPERLANVRFEREPDGSPFDWTVTAPPSVEIARTEGLQIHFSGAENIASAPLRQFATVQPGMYRFAAEVETSGLTTDQLPEFHIFAAHAASSGAKLDVIVPLERDMKRGWITASFEVPHGAEALQVQLERRASRRLDNKIQGSVHVYQVSLAPLGSASSTLRAGLIAR